LKVAIEVREAMHENDRSATGFLPPDEFEAVANQFFARPVVSVQGWERAIDAQSRIVREVEHVLARNRVGDVLFVGHGAVGTLLYCHYAARAIDRALDQPSGGGHCFAFAKGGVSCCILGSPWKTCRKVGNFGCKSRSIADRLQRTCERRCLDSPNILANRE
jgi:broad specificity phosphatase PhoE